VRAASGFWLGYSQRLDNRIYRLPGTEMVFKVSPQTAEYLSGDEYNDRGFGDRTEDIRTHSMGGVADILWEVPSLFVPIRFPQKWVYEGSPFTFVTDGRATKRCSASESGRRMTRTSA
jgi:hypothetical protein